MSKELDKSFRLFKKPFHVVLVGSGLDVLLPSTYNTKFTDAKMRYQQVDDEHYLFVKSATGCLSTTPPNNLGYRITISYVKNYKANDYFQQYKNIYQDVSEQLSEDVELWCKVLSIPQTPPGTKTYELVLEAQNGLMLITGSAIPHDELDEFLVLAEYIQHYDGDIPTISDKDGYKNNTYHPEIILMNMDDEERLLEQELEQYEAEDHDEYDDVDDDWEICVNLNDKEQMRRVLNRLIDNFDEIEEFLSFGSIVNGEFQEYQHEEEDNKFSQVGLCSELFFFEAAVKFPALHKKIIDYINLAIDEEGPWMDEETPKALHAAYALAMYDQKYIPKYIELLRVLDMDHEVYQCGQIAKLIEKWQKYDNAIRLMASRSCSVAGQHGFENLDPEILDSIQRKETFLKYLLLDAKENHYAYRDHLKSLMSVCLEPALETVDIDFNEVKLINALRSIHENSSISLDDIA